MCQPRARHVLIALAVVSYLGLGCVLQDSGRVDGGVHRWWTGLGPVLPHDSFPADCQLCHLGQNWNQLRPNFSFDHERETGVPLVGAHQRAQCLRCHNDRGPVQTFLAQGCVGCHEDVHFGELSATCTSCHTEVTWQPVGQIERHNRTRFPLVGAHLATACNRCHPGAFVGNFLPTATECVSCHMNDLAGATNPPHIGLGWVDHCDRCHVPTAWREARIPR